jgi:hypothetical protein
MKIEADFPYMAQSTKEAPKLPVAKKTLPQKAKSLEPSDLTSSIKKAKAEGKTFEEFLGDSLKKDYRTVHQVDTKTASSITDI